MRALIPAIPGHVLLLALGVSCAEAPAPTLAEFARAQAVRFEFAGTWRDERSTIRIHSTGEGEFVMFGSSAPSVTQEGAATTEQMEVAQGWERAGVLCVHPSFDGIGALYPCLIGDEQVLLPDVGVTLEPGDPPTPRGRIFRRIEEPHSSSEEELYRYHLPGPEDENRPAPWREVYGGG